MIFNNGIRWPRETAKLAKDRQEERLIRSLNGRTNENFQTLSSFGFWAFFRG